MSAQGSQYLVQPALTRREYHQGPPAEPMHKRYQRALPRCTSCGEHTPVTGSPLCVMCAGWEADGD